jgi:hypothetical protein
MHVMYILLVELCGLLKFSFDGKIRACQDRILVKIVLAAAVSFLLLEDFLRKICVFLFSIFSSFVLRDCSPIIRFSTKGQQLVCLQVEETPQQQ